MILVILVVYLFLQSWRATLIPAVAVPVSLIGTFAGMAALGFSINTLTLFGMILAIGIVVDDAIVVVENVERHMEEGLSPKEAAKKAMDEVTGPVIAIVLVLCAVFVPVGFLGGITGQLYKQFAITIAISAFVPAVGTYYGLHLPAAHFPVRLIAIQPYCYESIGGCQAVSAARGACAPLEWHVACSRNRQSGASSRLGSSGGALGGVVAGGPPSAAIRGKETKCPPRLKRSAC